MKLKFKCPSGHALSAAEDRAGHKGKCPQCGAEFVVPIAFLCPNGHQLTGPAELQGKPGQCPHCGERFLIPVYDDEESATNAGPAARAEETPEQDQVEIVDEVQEVEELDEFEEVGESPGESDLEAVARAVTASDSATRAKPSGFDQVELVEPASAAPVAPSAADLPALADGHPLAALFLRFWARREQGTVVEVHVREGEMIEPDWFAASLSTRDYGLFAVQEKDGTYTMTTIPWETVSRITFRRLNRLAEGVFE